jgi:transcription elongation factor GreB
MSKAFTKEDDGSQGGGGDDDGSEEAAELQLPPGQKNYITPAGAERLKAELHKLLHEERPALVQTVTWAASNGDRSENGDYLYGKRRLREIDRRIRFLSKRLEAAEIVNPAAQQADRVLFGASVTIARVDGREDSIAERDHLPRTYRIVGIDETAVSQGEISWISPMARALLNSRQGDVVTLHTPRGDEELEILEIRYL